MSQQLKAIYSHMRKHSGYVVGENALGALRIAQEAYRALDIGLSVTWEHESEDWMTFAGEPEEEYRAKFKSGEWECFYAFVKDEAGNILASLGGIVLGRGSSDYKLVCEYELLAEAFGAIKRGFEQ